MTGSAQLLRTSMAYVPQPGAIFAGKYRVEHVLGAGGMGIVVAATHLNLDERFAIKLLLPDPSVRGDTASTEQIVARFLREGRAAIKIRSEHVVRVLDVDTSLDSGTPFMVMEYLDGRDLEAILASDGPMAIAPAVDIVLQACEAIAEAHGLGIVHRDLKPANLFLTRRPDGTPLLKVLDFGISKINPEVERESRITGNSAVLGSPHYMSPEQLRSTHDVDGRTDIWALGAILHELLTGKPAFRGDTMLEVCANILKDPPVSLRAQRVDVPSGLENVVLGCLEKELPRRFDSVANLAIALCTYGSGDALASTERILRVLRASGIDVEPAPSRSGVARLRAEAAPSIPTAVRGRRAIVAAILVGIALGATGGSTFIWHRQGPQVPAGSARAAHRAPQATSAPLAPEPAPSVTATGSAAPKSRSVRSRPRPHAAPPPAPPRDDADLFDDRK